MRWYKRVLSKYATFSGRARRKEYSGSNEYGPDPKEETV